MSNAGPLTTTFTAPSSCATATGLYQIWSSGSSSYHYEQGPLATMAACFPSGYDAGAHKQYYSPGLCPSGYTAACSSTEVVSATETETAYTCCPTAVDYMCAMSSVFGRPYLGCTTTFGDALAIAGVTVVSDGSSYPTSKTEAAGNGLGANSIAVRFRSGDFSTTDGPAAAATTTSSAPRWTTSCPTEASDVPSSAPAASGLSTPGIAGIGAGSAAGALLLVGFFSFFLCTRRRKQRALRSQLRPPPPPMPTNHRRHHHHEASQPSSRPPVPPPKDMRAWLASPTPTPGEPKDNHVFLPLRQPSRPRETFAKPAPDGGGGCGPYELSSCCADEKPPGRPHELYGGWWGSCGADQFCHPGDETKKRQHRQHLVSPPPPSFKSSSDHSATTIATTATNTTAPASSSSSAFLLAKSRLWCDHPLRSSPASPSASAPGPFWSPPPSYGAQPAELDYSPPPAAAAVGGGGGGGGGARGRCARSLRPEERWRTGSERLGTSWAPAELEATACAGGGGFL